MVNFKENILLLKNKTMTLMDIFKQINFENLSIYASVTACIFMASFYVISLYLWSKQNRYNRNDPSVSIGIFKYKQILKDSLR